MAALDLFQPAVRRWFEVSFPAPTAPQAKGWPAIARGGSTLLLAPTGTGKTLAAFLVCIDRLMFRPPPADPKRRCRVLYVSPLKALAVDVERNLRAPLAGIARIAGERGDSFHLPTVSIRTGDTPSADRARFARRPDDVLITTPESLYLVLTSQAREALRGVETVIVDEIHALVPGKRGAHLALSLERLEELAPGAQRIGLSATQRPLDEVARFLGGAHAPTVKPRRKDLRRHAQEELHGEFTSPAAPRPRDVAIVDAGSRRALRLKIEVPVEDMATLDGPPEPDLTGPAQPTIWTAIHPRLLELVQAHRTTLVFVNARRLAERLAGALNELAGETLVLAHHGSIAREKRVQIEDDLKAGRIKGLVATSTLELGIDMGAIDLVVQIEAPPTVGSGLQRIGRAGHSVTATSEGVIFPKFRGDLLACAALTRAMREGQVEPIRYPRNPLDVLAQQIVAMVSMEPWHVDELFAAVRRAAPFAELSRGAFEGVLDMLSGRYPSDDFAELKPRVTWDRIQGLLTTRDGARKVAVANAGTIPDRGLYGVYHVDSPHKGRVGELDEEMVFETPVGQTFVLGASTWRVESITHDRVLVSPAPGEPGKMPFWKGDNIGRPVDTGRAIGALARKLQRTPEKQAVELLTRDHDLDARAAKNLLQYLSEQKEAAGVVPDERTILVERTRDELGDFRVCVLSPLGGRIHAPWAMAVEARVREERGLDVETLWTNDGFVVRFPDLDEPPPPELLLPAADEVEELVLRQLSATAFFAARFRECAGRALLLPRRRPGARAPLWQLRKRASDLLQVAARFGSFPVVLETYRECLRDAFDMPALVDVLGAVERRETRVVTVDSQVPSPFASSILFGYMANFLYDADAPLAERRAQALAIDPRQLRELLGEAELRQLLDPDSIAQVAAALQHVQERKARSADGLHDLLLRLGDLTMGEIEQRCETPAVAESIHELVRSRRAVSLPLSVEERFVAVEDASRYRDALGVPLPQGLPASLLEPQEDPLGELCRRYARTHPPFGAAELALRYGVGVSVATEVLDRLVAAGKLLEGGFLPGGAGREYCDADVLQAIRRRSLAKLRHEVEPVRPESLARLVTHWQGVASPRAGLDAVLDAVEKLQGCPLPASLLESEILPARVSGYQPGDLDQLAAAGEVVWRGVEPLGERDGRVALYLTDHLPSLWIPPGKVELGELESRVHAELQRRGASFFAELHAALGGGFPGELTDALWSLTWKGLVTNDTFRCLRAFTRRESERRGRTRPFRTRRILPPSAEGRWSLVASRAVGPGPSPTERATGLAQQLLARYGVVTREVAAAENLPGGFTSVYEVFKALEGSGRVRRGYFVAGVSAMQFALPAAVERLRALDREEGEPEVLRLSAADPACAWGALLRWPEGAEGRGPSRSVGHHVILVNGALAGHVTRGARTLTTFLPAEEPDRSKVARLLAERLARDAAEGLDRGGALIETIDAVPATSHALAPFLQEAGFSPSVQGFHMPRALPARHAGR